MAEKKFRKDINGLRAIAVLSVIVYHFSPKSLSGGFIGVDIFFVISGFLMTKIILSGIGNNSFSIISFFYARASRIIPVLMFAVCILLVYGLFFLEPLSYKILGKHSLDSLLFFSNITYDNESGYFDLESSQKFLLHTWSLSVEWQFYILYPIILLIFNKLLGFKGLRYFIIISFILLFIISMLMSYREQTSSYYLLIPRSWELIAGGVVFVLGFETKNKVLYEIISLSLIAISLMYINNDMVWPGVYTLLPIIACMLLILNNNNNGFLSLPLLQHIGNISYSSYIYHWPILVICKKFNYEISFVNYLALTYILSIATYYTLERRRSFKFLSISIYVIILWLSFVISQNGIQERVSKEFQYNLADFRYRFEGHLGMPQSEDVQYINGSEHDFDYILIGDSHARHFFSYINESGLKVASLAIDGCTSTKNYYSKHDLEFCESRYEKEIEFIKKNPGKPVIISYLWPAIGTKTISRSSSSIIGLVDFDKIILNEIKLMTKDIDTNKNKIFIVGNTPTSNYVVYECLAKENLPAFNIFNISKCQSTNHSTPDNINTLLSSLRIKGVEYIDPRKATCDKNNICSLMINREPLYTDRTHLSKEGSRVVGKVIFEEIKNSIHK